MGLAAPASSFRRDGAESLVLASPLASHRGADQWVRPHVNHVAPDAFVRGGSCYFDITTGTVWSYGHTTTLVDWRWLKASSATGKATMIVRVTDSPGWIFVSGVNAGCEPFFSVGKASK